MIIKKRKAENKYCALDLRFENHDMNQDDKDKACQRQAGTKDKGQRIK